jgi:hypothetical protein
MSSSRGRSPHALGASGRFVLILLELVRVPISSADVDVLTDSPIDELE